MLRTSVFCTSPRCEMKLAAIAFGTSYTRMRSVLWYETRTTLASRSGRVTVSASNRSSTASWKPRVAISISSGSGSSSGPTRLSRSARTKVPPGISTTSPGANSAVNGGWSFPVASIR